MIGKYRIMIRCNLRMQRIRLSDLHCELTPVNKCGLFFVILEFIVLPRGSTGTIVAWFTKEHCVYLWFGLHDTYFSYFTSVASVRFNMQKSLKVATGLARFSSVVFWLLDWAPASIVYVFCSEKKKNCAADIIKGQMNLAILQQTGDKLPKCSRI